MGTPSCSILVVMGLERSPKVDFARITMGVLEGIVPYTRPNEDPILLADKEIRYLLYHCDAKAHVVLIFDCCHSGDISRDLMQERRQRRMARLFAQRSYEQFVFHRDAAESSFKANSFDEVFPDTNFITLSACQEDESAWEDGEGGVFTRSLLQTLSARDQKVSYAQLIRLTEIGIRHRS